MEKIVVFIDEYEPFPIIPTNEHYHSYIDGSFDYYKCVKLTQPQIDEWESLIVKFNKLHDEIVELPSEKI